YGPPFSSTLQGAVNYGTLTPSPSPLVFPPTVVGCSLTQTVTITNTGSCDLVVKKPVAAGAGYTLGPYNATTIDGSFTVAPGASKTLTISFAPTTIAHAIPGTLTLRS